MHIIFSIALKILTSDKGSRDMLCIIEIIPKMNIIQRSKQKRKNSIEKFLFPEHYRQIIYTFGVALLINNCNVSPTNASRLTRIRFIL